MAKSLEEIESEFWMCYRNRKETQEDSEDTDTEDLLTEEEAGRQGEAEVKHQGKTEAEGQTQINCQSKEQGNTQVEPQTKVHGNRYMSVIADILFYISVISIVFCTVFLSSDRQIGRFRLYEVLIFSMLLTAFSFFLKYAAVKN